MGLLPGTNPLDTANSAVPQAATGLGAATAAIAASLGLTPSAVSEISDRQLTGTSAALTKAGSLQFLTDAFLNWSSVDGKDFAKLYGYEFVISNNGQPVFRLALPLNPSNISIQVPAAVQTTVTMKGITEDHNGAPLRPIEISGTTGVLPKDLIAAPRPDQQGVADYLFRNTISAAKQFVNQGSAAIQAFSGNANAIINPKLNFSGQELTALGEQTGFYHFQKMARFFDTYLALKKHRNGRSYRLHLNMYKDTSYYDVTLNSFSWQKAAGTLEYQYRIALTAWRRRENPIGTVRQAIKTGRTNQAKLNAVAAIINGISSSRIALQKASNILAGFRADVQDNVVTPIRESILLAKDFVGIAATMADMPNSIISGAKSSIGAAVTSLRETNPQSWSKTEQQLKDTGNMFGSGTQGKSAYADSLEAKSANNSADLAATTESGSPSEAIFKDPNTFVEFFDGININDLPLSSEAQDQIDAEIERVRNLTADDLRERRDKIANYTASVSEAMGGGSATYNRVYGLQAPKTTFKKVSVDNVIMLSQLNDMQIALDQLINILDDRPSATDDDYYRFYADYAVSNGLKFNSSASKFYVPFPAGSSLEALAVQYLGDVDRWLEIAALNGLRAPYIDEDGYYIDLIGSGGDQSIIIGSADGLYIKQVVKLQSNTQQPTLYKIRSIDKISDEQTLVTFEGDDDLSIYTVADAAKMHVYIPNTINSNQLIAIPSQAAPGSDNRIKLGPDIEDLNGLARIARTDFMLLSNGDLSFTSGGDVLLASGLTNLVQAARIKLLTKQGSMLQHPDFGNPVEAGMSTAEINVRRVLGQLNRMFLSDSRFSGVLAGQLTLAGPALSVELLLGVSGSSVNLPISADLPL